MDRGDIIKIAEGLLMNEEGVETIQTVMKEKKLKSIREIAAELLPIYK